MTDADRSRVVMVRPAGDGKWGVVTPPEVFRDSARTTYDMATHTFGCHGSSRSAPQTCAGFLLRGASDNLTIRLAVVNGRIDPNAIDSPVELYSDYRAMAIANGL